MEEWSGSSGYFLWKEVSDDSVSLESCWRGSSTFLAKLFPEKMLCTEQHSQQVVVIALTLLELW